MTSAPNNPELDPLYQEKLAGQERVGEITEGSELLQHVVGHLDDGEAQQAEVKDVTEAGNSLPQRGQ